MSLSTFSEFGKDVPLDHAAVVCQCRLPAVHLHMALHVALRQTCYREFRLGRCRKRLQPPLDAVNDHGGLPAGRIGGHLSVAPERDALEPERAARLDDEALAAAGIDPNAEAL